MAVHPHVRGAYQASFAITASYSGSSPLAWGLLIESEENENDSRFIPTCVGLTFAYSGELPDFHGSSPRAWGLQSCVRHMRERFRFIPTCVGLTMTGWS